MTRAQRIAIARHQVFADWLFGHVVARKPMYPALDDLFKRFYAPARDLFPIDTPLLTKDTRVEFVGRARWFEFPLSVKP